MHASASLRSTASCSHAWCSFGPFVWPSYVSVVRFRAAKAPP
jgi:hypothetical protein